MGSALGDQPISARFDVGVLETRQATTVPTWPACEAVTVTLSRSRSASLYRVVSYARSDGHAESPMTSENKRYHECTKLPLPAFGDGMALCARAGATAPPAPRK